MAGERGGVHDAHVNLRLPAELVDLAEELVPVIGADPKLKAIGRINRSTVLRMAIERGLHSLDEEYREPRRSA